MAESDLLGNRYRLLELLGRGGMGEVHRAFDTVLNRHVAIKLLPTGMRSVPERRERFLREARAAAALQHPSIATVFDFGETQEAGPQLFLAMELVEGKDLAEAIARGPLGESETLRLGVALGEALVAAHEAGIIHRDLKPANVRIGADGNPKILDFGLARLTLPADEEAATEAALTRAGAAMGSVPYMAPEQARGEVVDSRADQFSLGATLLEAASGERFVSPPSFAEYLGVLEGTDLKMRAHELLGESSQLAPVLLKMLAFDRAQRFRTTEEAVAALKAVARGSAPGSDGLPLSSSASDPKREKGSPLKFLVPVAILLMAAFFLGRSFLRAPRSAAVSPAGEVTEASRRLAVLPFKNSTGDLAYSYLSRTIATGFSGSTDVRVLAEGRTRPYAFAANRYEVLRDELGADFVLEGFLAPEQDRVLAGVELVDLSSGEVMWQETFEEAPDQASARIREQVLRGLLQQFGEDVELAVVSEEVSELAWNQYLKALQFLDSGNPADLEIAEHYLQEVTRSAPGMAPAWAALSELKLSQFSNSQDGSDLQVAITAGETATRLDAASAEGALALARAYRLAGRDEDATLWLHRAEQRSEHDPAVEEAEHWLLLGTTARLCERARQDARAGRFEMAEIGFRQALDQAPDSWRVWQAWGSYLSRRSRNPEAVEALRRAHKLAPDRSEPLTNLIALALKDYDLEQAQVWIDAFKGPVLDSFHASNIGTVSFFRGDIEAARQYYRLAVTLSPGDDVHHRNLGDALQELGETDAAMFEYQQALSIVEDRLAVFSDRKEWLLRRAQYLAKASQCSDAITAASSIHERVDPHE